MTLNHERISARTAALLLTVILLLGFAFRMWIILPYSQGPNGYSDENGYQTGGITFLNTGYISYADADEQTAATCVGMQATLASLFWLFGYTPQGLTVSHLFFSCFSLISAITIYLLAHQLHSRLAGLLGAALCALEPGVASLSCIFLTETPYICFNLLALYLLLRCAQEWHLGYFWGGVLCMIAAALFKGLALLVFLAVIPVLFRRKIPLKRWLPKAAIGTLAFILCFTPWWVRNYQLLGKFVPFTANRGDIQLMGSYMGFGYPEGTYQEKVNELDAEAWNQNYQDDTERRFARRGEVGKERLAQWFQENPLAFLFSHLIYKPFVMTVDRFQPVYIMPLWMISAAWWGCLLLACWGLLCPRFGGRVRPDYYAPLFYLLISVFATAIYAPLARYGAPYVPLWLFYTACGGADLLQRIKPKR